ncbi:MAG: MerC domain-containing protein [Bacteroidetes bacterium]|nr:MerC domain-containing protein [Fibrella sp.]
MKTTFLVRQKADYVGITGSLLCIVHCLVTPILVMTPAWLKHDAIRIGLLNLNYGFIGVNIIAVWSATRHTSRRIARLLWGFLMFFAAGLLLEDLHPGFEYLAYAASLGLVITHITNIRYCRSHPIH